MGLSELFYQKKIDSQLAQTTSPELKSKTFYPGETAKISDAVTGSKIVATVKIRAVQPGTGVPSISNVRAISGRASIDLTITNGTDTITYTITPATMLYGVHANEETIAISENGGITITHKTKPGAFVGSNSWSGHYRNGKGLWVAGVTAAAGSAKVGGWCIADKLDTAMAYSTADRDSICPSVSGTILVALTDASTGLTASSTIAEVSAAFNAFFAANHTNIVYPLATPTTETLAAQQIVALSGVNTISNTASGEMTITYYMDAQSRIDNGLVPVTATTPARKPVITFTSDDGLSGDYTTLAPWVEAYGVPMTIFVISGVTGRMNQWQLLKWQNEYGCEIASHTKDHLDLSDLTTDAAIEAQWADSITALAALGCNVRTGAYPNGAHNARVRRVTRKYFKAATSGPSQTKKYYPGTIPAMDIHRVMLGTIDDVAPNEDYPTANTLAYYKALVDEAVQRKGWLVFCMHGGNASFTTAQKSIAVSLIEYVKSLGVDIMTFSDAYELFKGQELGDCTSSEKNDGICTHPAGGTNQTAQLFKLSEGTTAGIDANVPWEVFPENCISYTPIQNGTVHGYPTSGTLITDKTADDSQLWSQTLYAFNNPSVIFRRGNSSGIAGDFVPITPYAFTTANRPTMVPMGYGGYDSTLQKPVWCTTAGVAEQSVLTVSAGAAASGNITITLNGTAFTVAVAAGDTIDAVVAKILAATFTGWTTVNTPHSGRVRFRKLAGGAVSASAFTDTGTTSVSASFASDVTGATAIWKDASGTTV